MLPQSTLKNQSSAIKNNLCLMDYLVEELAHGAIIGPFSCNPFSRPCVVSPLQTVPKRDSSKLRVVRDLSFPEGESAVADPGGGSRRSGPPPPPPPPYQT